MILKYSLPVFCFLLAGYSCTSGHKEKRTSTATETTCTDPMYTVLIHADSIHATLLQKNKVGNNRPRDMRKARWPFTWIPLVW